MTHDINDRPDGRIFVEIADENLEFTPIAVSDRTPTARQILSYRDLAPHNEYVVLQWLQNGDIEDRRLEEEILFEGDASPRLIIVQTDRTFRFFLDDRSLVWPRNVILETALRKLGAIEASKSIYLARTDQEDQLLKHGERVRLGDDGAENFYSRSDVWKLNVQGVIIESNSPTIQARDAIRRAGLDADASWILVLKTAQGRQQIGIDDLIDLRLPGIEKLRLTPREINNGEIPTGREHMFDLLAIDETGLDDRKLKWSTIIDGGRRWLLLRDYPLPGGYTAEGTDVAIEIPVSYNAAELDMFYCNPPLALVTGRTIPQTNSSQTIRGAMYQRWSRHRGPASRWRSGKDNVLSHLALVDEALAREVGE